MGRELVTGLDANIDIRPDVLIRPEDTQVSIGDLHANANKFLYVLVKHGVVDLTEEQYARLAAIYRKNTSKLTENDLAEYRRLINGLHITRTDMLVRLLGDETGDRGQNDYFILLILAKLRQEHVPVSIILSNHGVEFVEACERVAVRGKFQRTMLGYDHAGSLDRMQMLVDKGLVSIEQISQLIDIGYKPALKALDYSLDKDGSGITLYTHAGVGLYDKTEALHLIGVLADKMGVVYKDETPQELAATIDAINGRFFEHVRSNTVHTLYAANELNVGYHGHIGLALHNPLEFMMWNRHYDKIRRPAQHKKYNVHYVHGHDSDDPSCEHITNLDNNLGKLLYPHPYTPGMSHTGIYTALVSDDQLPDLLLNEICTYGSSSSSSSSSSVLTQEPIQPPLNFDDSRSDDLPSEMSGILASTTINAPGSLAQSLSRAINAAHDKYAAYHSSFCSSPENNRGKRAGVFSFFLHWRSGLTIASQLSQTCAQPENFASDAEGFGADSTVNLALMRLLGNPKTGFNGHSFVSYLMDEINKVLPENKRVPFVGNKRYDPAACMAAIRELFDASVTSADKDANIRGFSR